MVTHALLKTSRSGDFFDTAIPEGNLKYILGSTRKLHLSYFGLYVKEFFSSMYKYLSFIICNKMEHYFYAFLILPIVTFADEKQIWTWVISKSQLKGWIELHWILYSNKENKCYTFSPPPLYPWKSLSPVVHQTIRFDKIIPDIFDDRNFTELERKVTS